MARLTCASAEPRPRARPSRERGGVLRRPRQCFVTPACLTHTIIRPTANTQRCIRAAHHEGLLRLPRRHAWRRRRHGRRRNGRRWNGRALPRHRHSGPPGQLRTGHTRDGSIRFVVCTTSWLQRWRCLRRLHWSTLWELREGKELRFRLALGRRSERALDQQRFGDELDHRG